MLKPLFSLSLYNSKLCNLLFQTSNNLWLGNHGTDKDERLLITTLTARYDEEGTICQSQHQDPFSRNQKKNQIIIVAERTGEVEIALG